MKLNIPLENTINTKETKTNFIPWGWIIIIVLAIFIIGKIMNRPDRELTPQEKQDNESVCSRYYGSGEAYQDCINGNYGRD